MKKAYIKKLASLERSVKEFEQKFGLRFNNPDDVPLQGDVQDWLTQTLQAERQRCEEMVEERRKLKKKKGVKVPYPSPSGIDD